MEPTKKTLLDISNPAKPVGSVAGLGEISVRSVSVNTLRELTKLEADGKVPDRTLVAAMISALAQKSDGSALTDAEVATLVPDDRDMLVTGIIARHPEWFLETSEQTTERSKEGIQRQEGETDESYLARGFRTSAASFADSMRGTGELLRSKLFGSSDRMKAMLEPGLAANLGASRRVADMVKAMSATPSGSEAVIRHEPFKFEPPEMPRNPVLDTNETLAEVAEQIGQMRQLAAATADMQRTLNDTASTALTQFSSGAEASARSARDGLTIAKIGLVIAVVTALLTLATIVVAIRLANAQSADSSARDRAATAQVKGLIASERALIGSLDAFRRERVADAARAAARREAGKRRHSPDRR